MDLVVLFGRVDDGFEDYVEALAVISGYSHDGNPQWIADEKTKVQESGDYAALKVVRLRLSSKDTQLLEHSLGMQDVDLDPKVVEIES